MRLSNIPSCFGTSLIIRILLYELIPDLCDVGDAVLHEFCCYSSQEYIRL
ncbi:hypothetical protein T01_12899 [Trichinella spiralis]|uniref:Uncharacterized protein n=1 Tax=Trichinella spiralis TaxID=6334 RepID=A0A0V0YT92_TRISP|nr:hypothetical protein T01_12899 [Trichinella spiralis]